MNSRNRAGLRRPSATGRRQAGQWHSRHPCPRNAHNRTRSSPIERDREQIPEGSKRRNSAGVRPRRIGKDRTSLGSNPTVTAKSKAPTSLENTRKSGSSSCGGRGNSRHFAHGRPSGEVAAREGSSIRLCLPCFAPSVAARHYTEALLPMHCSPARKHQQPCSRSRSLVVFPFSVVNPTQPRSSSTAHA